MNVTRKQKQRMSDYEEGVNVNAFFLNIAEDLTTTWKQGLIVNHNKTPQCSQIHGSA